MAAIKYMSQKESRLHELMLTKLWVELDGAKNIVQYCLVSCCLSTCSIFTPTTELCVARGNEERRANYRVAHGTRPYTCLPEKTSGFAQWYCGVDLTCVRVVHLLLSAQVPSECCECWACVCGRSCHKVRCILYETWVLSDMSFTTFVCMEYQPDISVLLEVQIWSRDLQLNPMWWLTAANKCLQKL